jgi:uncharacterized protein (TIGR03437 family)
MVFRWAAGILLSFCPLGCAQPPAIAQSGVFNAASLMSPTLAGGALARGAKITIAGVRLPTAQQGAVTLSQGATSVDAQILSAEPDRIQAILPMDAPLGDVQLRVRRGEETSMPFPVTIRRANTGLYSRNGTGWGPGAIRNLGKIGGDNSPNQAAQPSERIAIAATGAGDGSPPKLFIGAEPARVISVKPSNATGDQEIIVEIPARAPEGCFVPVYAQHGGSPPSNVVTVAIRRGGGACRTPLDFPVPPITSRRVGSIVLARVSNLLQNGRETSVEDEASAAFVERKRSRHHAVRHRPSARNVHRLFWQLGVRLSYATHFDRGRLITGARRSWPGCGTGFGSEQWPEQPRNPTHSWRAWILSCHSGHQFLCFETAIPRPGLLSSDVAGRPGRRSV